MGKLVRALRLPFVTASALTALIGVSWAWVYGNNFNALNALLAVLGVVFLHLGANVINDYFDTVGSDPLNRYPTPFSGGSRVVLENIFTRRQVLIISLACFAIAGVLGLWLYLRGRPLVLLLGFIGFLCGFLYSASPVQLMSRGLGEIVIFFAFGPLITWGTGYAVEGVLSWKYFLLGLPMGFIVTGILWINEFPDFEADRDAGKHNLVVRLGLDRARYGYVILGALTFLSVILLTLVGVYPWLALLSLLGAVPVIKAGKNLWVNHRNPAELVPSQAATIQAQSITALLIVVGIAAWKLIV